MKNTDSDRMSKENQYVSIVIPVFNEEENLEMLYARLKPVLQSLSSPWEIILVDDGSKDNSWQRITGLAKKDDRVRGIRFSRNFGHQYALFAGLSKAQGKIVISMDADLQHPPEVIPRLIEEWKKGNKIVNTFRIEVQNISWFKKWTSKLFYKTFSFLSGVPMESGMADFRLLDRLVVDSLLLYREEGLFLRGIVQTLGFPCSIIEYQCQDRFRGTSKYTFMRMIKFAWIGITSFSIVPLRISIIIGVLTSCIAFYQLIDAIYIKLFTDRAVPGWASAIGIISLMFGILFIFLGIMGEYIGRILIETRGRPRYLVREEIGFNLQ